MSGLGTGSLGVGAAAAGGPAGGASMPSGGLTAFGYKGAVNVPGLKVNLYDLKQAPNGTKTDIGEDFDKGAVAEELCNYKAVRDLIGFMEAKWDPKLLEKKYYRAKDTITAYQFWIPNTLSQAQVLKAFGADSSVKPGFFIVHYTGKVTAPKDGEFQFFQSPYFQPFYAIRFDEKNIYCSAPPENVKKLFPNGTDLKFKVSAGRTYPIEFLALIKAPRLQFKQLLMIRQVTPPKTYPPNPFRESLYSPVYPIFQVKSGLPLPEYVAPDWSKKPPGADVRWVPVEPMGPKVEEAIVFPAQK